MDDPSFPPHHRPFTVARAEALLPHLEAAFRSLDLIRGEMTTLQDRLQVLDLLWGEGIRKTGNPDHGEFLGLERELRMKLHEIEELVRREVLSRGLRFPVGGLEHGIVDFPSTWEGRWIYLCWRRGEPRVSVWHEVDGGFAGRRPITREQANRMGMDHPSGMDDSLLDF